MAMSLWTGEFGDDYTARNRAASAEGRVDIWRMLIPRHTESILEVGANVGKNLEAIETFFHGDLMAIEPNDKARAELSRVTTQVTSDYADKISLNTGSADLVFTCGVLIHIPPKKLLASMREIHRVARRYIVCGEYFAPSEEMVPYRGHDDALWRRDYGSIYLDNFSDLHCVSTMFAWRRVTAFDNLTFWLFEKGPRWN
jgi:spore coat polysaccharide biosynthesis protein SpsF